MLTISKCNFWKTKTEELIEIGDSNSKVLNKFQLFDSSTIAYYADENYEYESPNSLTILKVKRIGKIEALKLEKSLQDSKEMSIVEKCLNLHILYRHYERKCKLLKIFNKCFKG
jgi:hypothetical protein